MDPNPGAWKLTELYKETWFPAFPKGFCTFVGMFFDLLPTSSIFIMGKSYPKKLKKVKNFHVLECWMFSFEG